jgi:hypothetical protein
MKHMEWRGPSFLQGLKIRYRPRRKFMGAKVLNKEEKLPPADYVRKVGDTTVVRFTMPFGDTVPYWQNLSDELAGAFGKLEAVVNPYRRHHFTDLRPVGDFRCKLHPVRAHWWQHPPMLEFAFKPDLLSRPPFVQFKHAEAKKRVPRVVEVTFLDRDPFVKPVTMDWLNLHRPMDIYASAGPTAKNRAGLPHFENERLSAMWVAITGGGKTNTERALLHRNWERVQARLAENWGMDLAFGVELAPMADQFARVEYGEDPVSVRDFVREVRETMQDRLRGMREDGINYFVESPGRPLIDVYLDEARLLKLPDFDPYRGEIYRDMSATLTNMRKAGMKWLIFTQTAKLENFQPRDDVPIIYPGVLGHRRHVDMVAGEGSWASGMKVDQLDPDNPGIYYRKTEGARAPDQVKYGDVPTHAIAKLPKAPPSYLDPCWSVHEPSAVERGQGAPVEVPVSEAPRLFVMPPR